MTTNLSVIDKNLPIDLGVADEIISGLKGRLTGLTANTYDGYQMVKAGIAEARTFRTGVEKARKELKKSALDWGRKVDTEAKRVTDLIMQIETPLREEKSRIDDEAERKRKAVEKAERLAAEAKERAEKEAREAEEQAKREEEKRQHEAEQAKLKAERESLAKERKKLDAERLESEKRLRAVEEKNRTEREAIEAEKRKLQENDRQKQEAKETASRKAADEKRIAKEQAEAKRLAEERKPEREKLAEFGERLDAVVAPKMSTDWGKSQLSAVTEALTQAVNLCG